MHSLLPNCELSNYEINNTENSRTEILEDAVASRCAPVGAHVANHWTDLSRVRPRESRASTDAERKVPRRERTHGTDSRESLWVCRGAPLRLGRLKLCRPTWGVTMRLSREASHLGSLTAQSPTVERLRFGSKYLENFRWSATLYI